MCNWFSSSGLKSPWITFLLAMLSRRASWPWDTGLLKRWEFLPLAPLVFEFSLLIDFDRHLCTFQNTEKGQSPLNQNSPNCSC